MDETKKMKKKHITIVIVGVLIISMLLILIRGVNSSAMETDKYLKLKIYDSLNSDTAAALKNNNYGSVTNEIMAITIEVLADSKVENNNEALHSKIEIMLNKYLA